MNAIRVFVGLFNSRKNQVALATAIATLLAAFGLKDYPIEVIVAVIAAFVTLGATVINSIKAEDVAAKTAAGQVNAAAMTASQPTAPSPVTIDTNNVQVTPTGTNAPRPPTLGTMGG